MKYPILLNTNRDLQDQSGYLLARQCDVAFGERVVALINNAQTRSDQNSNEVFGIHLSDCAALASGRQGDCLCKGAVSHASEAPNVLNIKVGDIIHRGEGGEDLVVILKADYDKWAETDFRKRELESMVKNDVEPKKKLTKAERSVRMKKIWADKKAAKAGSK